MAAELTPPPEEFPRPGTVTDPPADFRKKRRLLRSLMAVTAAVLAVWLFVRADTRGAENAELPRPAAAEPAVTPAATPEPVATPEPTPTPEPTATPEPTPTPPPWDVYPLEDGEIQVTVYEDIFKDDFTGGDGSPLVILMEETIPEADFTELALPVEEVPSFYNPFVFCGFVLHYGNEFDRGYVSGTDPFVVVLGDTLTREDVERVPVSGDGVRYVNIHTMWRDEDEFITDPSQFGMPLTLDDGMGDAAVVEAKTPIASEGFTYLAVFPVPEREGYTFTGWYDGEGNRRDYLAFSDFYDPIETEWGIDYDWMNVNPVYLTAGWEPNE